jgi:hypothetical protein
VLIFTAQFGFADLVQPGLIQLQPNFDDFMDVLGGFYDANSIMLYSLAIKAL